MAFHSSSATRPEGVIQPNLPELVDVQGRISRGQFSEALAELANLHFEADSLAAYWANYLRGIAHFGQKELELGFAALISIYDPLRNRKQNPESDVFRLLGATLKKLGWYYRSKKEFDRAYAYHSIEAEYYDAYGSFAEMHDAAISLDMDAYSLGDMRLSEIWLRKSILAADQIRDAKLRNSSLGTSFNNLAGTLYSLVRFEEAEEVIHQSLRHWQAYEDEVGTQGAKVVWAYFGIGDVYQEWAKHLREAAQRYEEKKKLAVDAYEMSLALGSRTGVDEASLKPIRDRLAALREL